MEREKCNQFLMNKGHCFQTQGRGYSCMSEKGSLHFYCLQQNHGEGRWITIKRDGREIKRKLDW